MKNDSRIFGMLILLSAIYVIGGCAPGVPPFGTPIVGTALPVTVVTMDTPTPTASAIYPAGTAAPIATTVPRGQLSPTELKYRLIAQFGTIFFCDPDLYPVAHQVTPEQVAQRVAEIQKNVEEYNVILKFLGLPTNASLTAEQRSAVYAEHKRLNSIQLEPSGSQYTFALRTTDAQKQGFAIEGVINASGSITVTKRERTIISCPICLAAGTLIDTPEGQIKVQDLHVGMPIWTADNSGARQAGVVVATASRQVPLGAPIIHLVLDDGRGLYLSPLHPTFDGRRAVELVTGDVIDHARIVSTRIVSYQGDGTYDILASGETGAYWSNGILLRSTLSR